MKKNRGDEPIGVIKYTYTHTHTHTHTGVSQRNSLYSFLKQTKRFFLLQNRRTGGQNRSYMGGRVCCQWEGGGGGEKAWEGEYNEKYCVLMYVNEKMRPVETVSGMGKGG
jgi:hypothetical protein